MALAGALRLQGRLDEAQANIGVMLLLLGQPGQAVVPLRTALAMAPPTHPFRPLWTFYLGLADFMSGTGDRGATMFGKPSGRARTGPASSSSTCRRHWR